MVRSMAGVWPERITERLPGPDPPFFGV
jgi:hypothetical protein